jgi:hypothetical protein
MATKIPNGHEIHHIFHRKAFQNIPKMAFWYETLCTIWQPWTKIEAFLIGSHDRKISFRWSKTQSYDFWIYNYNASVVVG